MSSISSPSSSSDQTLSTLTGTLLYPLEARRTIDGQCQVRGTLAEQREIDFVWIGPEAEAWAESRPEPGTRATMVGRMTSRSWVTARGLTHSTTELLVDTMRPEVDE